MSIHDLRFNLDAYTEALVKSGAENMGPKDARDTLEERISPIVECFSHLVWMCGGEGDDFRKAALGLMSDALDDAFGAQIKEAEFERPARKQAYSTLNHTQQGIQRVHGARL